MPNIVYIAMSLDGYIADSVGDVGWLAPFERTDYGFDAFFSGVDRLVMGRNTYEQALGFGAWPYTAKPVTVVTHRPLLNPPDGVETFEGNLQDLLADRTPATWLVGGSEIVAQAIAAGCVDEFDIFVIPVTLGAGVPLFSDRLPPLTLASQPADSFMNGVHRLRYMVVRDE